jgi:Cu+-exporting ATPase
MMGPMEPTATTTTTSSPPAPEPDRVTDPVCGMRVNPLTAKGGSHTHARCTRRSCATRRELPDLRHGARAPHAPPSPDEDARRPRARRHDAALLDRAALTVPLFVLAMGEMIPGDPLGHLMSPRGCTLGRARARHAGGALGGVAVLRARRRRSKNRSLNMFTLIGLGVGVAYGYSVVADARPGSVPAAFRGHGGRSRCTSRPRR